MTYHVKDAVLTKEEFEELWQALGEHRRICREQNTSDIGYSRFNITESLIYKLVTDVKIKNTYIK